MPHHFRPRRYLLAASEYRAEMRKRFESWAELTGTRWDAYAGGDLDAFDVDSPHNQAFCPWYLYNWRADADEVEDDGSDTPTIAESYLERYSKRVSAMERRLIDLIADQPFSFHEVVAC